MGNSCVDKWDNLELSKATGVKIHVRQDIEYIIAVIDRYFQKEVGQQGSTFDDQLHYCIYQFIFNYIYLSAQSANFLLAQYLLLSQQAKIIIMNDTAKGTTIEIIIIVVVLLEELDDPDPDDVVLVELLRDDEDLPLLDLRPLTSSLHQAYSIKNRIKQKRKNVNLQLFFILICIKYKDQLHLTNFEKNLQLISN
ncbi:transmembrane protein, putative (macronuclear) [Tetrahymena thermophila SB210]|uniref:Transmembrane protein, putative n=1 Tax=Tetrahymena thermophila (strain SB210) TaxID=312017 RepID=W7X3J9_TETTS|nr:transmembrane protein, putative [Tetrahymena thermophila SB210]EWS70998.1 transmembrane protein, putative [Tetrahymena thermophila SB210]|eukprot:XP_012656482.1 transmembrane protein, putative [Tetrahymena thermophila SB210]